MKVSNKQFKILAKKFGMVSKLHYTITLHVEPTWPILLEVNNGGGDHDFFLGPLEISCVFGCPFC